jgi:hypothetical protein
MGEASSPAVVSADDRRRRRIAEKSSIRVKAAGAILPLFASQSSYGNPDHY